MIIIYYYIFIVLIILYNKFWFKIIIFNTKYTYLLNNLNIATSLNNSSKNIIIKPFIPPKIKHYHADGTGRDKYIKYLL